MKPRIIIITLALLLSGSMIPAQHTIDLNSYLATIGESNSQIEKELNKYLHYPIQPILSNDGYCMITFKITEEGTVDVLSIGTKEKDIANYVKTQMAKINVPSDDPGVGKIFTYRLKFAKEA